MKAILGRKVGMTQVFAEDGTMYPVSVIEVLPNVVTQVKTVEKDGYAAVQVGYEDKKESRANKAEKGIAKKANTNPHYFSKELKGDELSGYQLGDKITCGIFKKGEIVDVVGTSKGKGYSGTIKRWHMIIGPKGHGSGYHRGQGSFANQGRYNHGVMPGKHMSGHHGNKSVTLLNVQIVDVNEEKGYILIKGGVPGPRKAIVMIRTAVKVVKHPDVVKNLLLRVKEEPKVEEPAAQTPVAEAPVAEAPAAEAPVAEPATEESK
ncbi:MAG: 50S ribosomal protein L3 [Erysipelotrichaceae bacterium]|jgi:large subunit ribosomal protein L3|nr:50S ribosomal protein L3 [Erysipelotrichaceae bacterium]